MPTFTVVRTTANQQPNKNKYFLSGNLAKQYKHSIILICIKNEESDNYSEGNSWQFLCAQCIQLRDLKFPSRWWLNQATWKIMISLKNGWTSSPTIFGWKFPKKISPFSLRHLPISAAAWTSETTPPRHFRTWSTASLLGRMTVVCSSSTGGLDAVILHPRNLT